MGQIEAHLNPTHEHRLLSKPNVATRPATPLHANNSKHPANKNEHTNQHLYIPWYGGASADCRLGGWGCSAAVVGCGLSWLPARSRHAGHHRGGWGGCEVFDKGLVAARHAGGCWWRVSPMAWAVLGV